MHLSIPDQGRWLACVLDGHYRYYGVPGNHELMGNFRYEVVRHWHETLRRRSQRSRHDLGADVPHRDPLLTERPEERLYRHPTERTKDVLHQ